MASKKATPQPNVLPDALPVGLSARFWLLVVLTGIGTGLGAAALMALLHGVQHLAWGYHSGDFLEAVERTGALQRVLVVLGAGVLAAAGPAVIRRLVKGQASRLTEGIWFRSGELPAVRTIISGALSIILVGLGASLGREGAPKQSGAAIGSKLSHWFGLSPAERRLLAACGAGAGMGAVYNVPLGGALFAVEVLLGDLSLPLLLPALVASVIATAVSWLYLPVQATYALTPVHFALPLLAWAALIGPLMGLVSMLYIKAIAAASARKPKGWKAWAVALPVFAALGLLAIFFPQLLGNGKNAVQLAFSNQLAVPLLLTLFLLKPVVTVGCLSSGAPGGLFTPTVTTGALLGGALGKLWARLWPGGAPGAYAVVGAGAFLAAASQGPISSIVLLLELTHLIDPLMAPLMLAVAGATLVSRAIEPRSIYSARIKAVANPQEAGLPPARPRFDLPVARDMATIEASASYEKVLQCLLQLDGQDQPLYVVDEKGALAGRLLPRDFRQPRPGSTPIQTTTASDLAQPCDTVTQLSDSAQVKAQLAASEHGELPVLDKPGGKLVGVVRAHAANAGASQL